MFACLSNSCNALPRWSVFEPTVYIFLTMYVAVHFTFTSILKAYLIYRDNTSGRVFILLTADDYSSGHGDARCIVMHVVTAFLQ